jgi:hypothetical protein
MTLLKHCKKMDRTFAKIVYCTTKTSAIPPYYKHDFTLLKVNDSRAADNNITKIQAIRDAKLGFEESAENLSDAMQPATTNTTVIKLGIATGLNLRWEKSSMISI